MSSINARVPQPTSFRGADNARLARFTQRLVHLEQSNFHASIQRSRCEQQSRFQVDDVGAVRMT